MKTTFVCRANTNRQVYHRATIASASGRAPHRTIIKVSEDYQRMKLRLLSKIVNLPRGHPQRQLLFYPYTLKLRTRINRRVGRPRFNWAQETLMSIWQQVRFTVPEYRWEDFDCANEGHVERMYDVTQQIFNKTWRFIVEDD
eukprot:12643577-Prorocentrum_lima.AAC.1